MQSYPLGKVNFATTVTTASVSLQSSFLTSTINTASVALNFSGSIGPSGSGYTKVGATGVTGPTGPQGPKGFGVYLLSSTRATCCTYLGDFSTDTSGGGGSNCSSYTDGIRSVYSSDCTSIGNGCTLYLNSTCSTPANVYCFSDGSDYYCTNGSGVVTSTGGCST
jgi:hypothetical protein